DLEEENEEMLVALAKKEEEIQNKQIVIDQLNSELTSEQTKNAFSQEKISEANKAGTYRKEIERLNNELDSEQTAYLAKCKTVCDMESELTQLRASLMSAQIKAETTEKELETAIAGHNIDTAKIF